MIIDRSHCADLGFAGPSNVSSGMPAVQKGDGLRKINDDGLPRSVARSVARQDLLASA